MSAETALFTDNSLSASQKVEKLRDVLRLQDIDLEGSPVDEFIGSREIQVQFCGSFDNYLRWRWAEATGRGRVFAR